MQKTFYIVVVFRAKPISVYLVVARKFSRALVLKE